ncbi:MAG: phosphoesterase [Chloroflexi bacterium]|nr:phosphoesterase [Chloroflexota bacterium]MBP8057667.1 phosphoesterase [Chloroflexota bacterium]
MIRLVIRFLSLLLPLFILVSCRTQPQSQLPASTPLDVASVTWPAPPTPDSVVPRPTVQTIPAITVVVQWNDALLAAVRSGKPQPTVIARAMYMVHAAMYDAWSLYDATAIPTVLDSTLRRPVEEFTMENKAAAISYAAYQMLITLFPEYESQSRAFSSLLSNLGYQPIHDSSGSTAATIGLMAAQSILADRADDGANASNNYVDMTSAVYPELYAPINSADPNAPNSLGKAEFNLAHWQPLRVPNGTLLSENLLPVTDLNNPASYIEQVFLTPHWGAVRPFALSVGSQFRPPAPPLPGVSEPYTDALGQTMSQDESFSQQVNQLLTISAELTDEQKAIAEYWMDGPHSETPPGHWNVLAHGISWRDHHTLDEDVRFYFALNAALFDASIAAWDSKRAYDCVRPITAIRYLYAGQEIQAWGGPNQGTQTILGDNWLPYQFLTFMTPPFAEYVSGHSTFSAAAAELFTLFTGSNQFYDGSTLILEDLNQDGVQDMLGQHVVLAGSHQIENGPVQPVVLRWETFQDAADQAGLSRLYGGIHFQDGDLRGREMGRHIGQQTFMLAEQYWTGTLP